MSRLKIGLIILSVIVILIGLDFGTGYLGVVKTNTVEKAQKNADREVFKKSQSFIDGKSQEALKMYREYKAANPEDRLAIKKLVALSFSGVDEEDLPEATLRKFVRDCKYN